MFAKLGLLPALLLVVGLGNEARADEKVDWNQYLEPAGSRTPAKNAAAKNAAAAKANPPAKHAAPQSKPSPRQVAKSSSTASRAKPERQSPARSGHRH
jgi:hypothetical protein